MLLRLTWAVFLLAIATASHAAVPDQAAGYRALLIAGDSSSPAFDNGTEAMRNRLLARQVAPADIQRLSSSPAADDVHSATLDHVLAAIEQLRPAPGQGCFVFATSHGGFGEGLVMMPSENFLTPAALDAALVRGCGDAPTVVVISGCYSGGFTRPPMARANRIVLTAAREDRPSFGCGTGFQYTFYDRCLLAAFDVSATWKAAYGLIRACVAQRERMFRFRPSEPRAFFGDAVSGLVIPQRP
jgi:hypothetical protein